MVAGDYGHLSPHIRANCRYEAPPGARVMSVLRVCRVPDCRGNTNHWIQHCRSENCGAEMHAELESSSPAMDFCAVSTDCEERAVAANACQEGLA